MYNGRKTVVIVLLLLLSRIAVHKMRPIATDVAWSVCLCVCLLVTTVSCAKPVGGAIDCKKNNRLKLSTKVGTSGKKSNGGQPNKFVHLKLVIVLLTIVSSSVTDCNCNL